MCAQKEKFLLHIKLQNMTLATAGTLTNIFPLHTRTQDYHLEYLNVNIFPLKEAHIVESCWQLAGVPV